MNCTIGRFGCRHSFCAIRATIWFRVRGQIANWSPAALTRAGCFLSSMTNFKVTSIGHGTSKIRFSWSSTAGQ